MALTDRIMTEPHTVHISGGGEGGVANPTYP